MTLPDQVLIIARSEELKLSSFLVVFQRVDEQVKIINLFHLRHKGVDVLDELLNVNVNNHVYVNLMLPQKSERFSISGLLDELHNFFDNDNPRVDSF